MRYDGKLNTQPSRDPEFSLGSLEHEILKQVQNDKTSENKNKTLCHPEFISGSHEKEILKQVQNDIK